MESAPLSFPLSLNPGPPSTEAEDSIRRNWEEWRSRTGELKDEQLAAFMRSAEENATLKHLLESLYAFSPYLSKLALNYPDIIRSFIEEDADHAFNNLMISLEGAQSTLASLTHDQLLSLLRRHKSRLALLAAMADLTGHWSLEQVTGALSDFAQLALVLATDYLLLQAYKSGEVSPPEITEDQKNSSPSENSGLVILAMGKLGARELNYSSDIDLIIFYEQGKLPYKGRYNEQRFYTRFAHDLVQIMQNRTHEGYVFRTDLRLRPDPASTPPAISILAAYNYYESVGQNWERAAMIKARAVAGDLQAGADFIKQISPFMWRKSLDFAAIQDIQSIKRQMDTRLGGEIVLGGHNVKLGLGGIREIEFYVQIYQLIWGGRRPGLRSRGTCETLAQLATSELIPMQTASDLTQAYIYLRTLEHRLQMIDDQQTHSLPENDNGLLRVAQFMGYATLEEFERSLLFVLHSVHEVFANAFPHMQPLASQGNLVFTGSVHDPETLRNLSRMGFSEPERISETIMGWHHGSRRCTRTKRARELLTELMPALLEELSDTASPDHAFHNFDAFLVRLPAAVQLFSLFSNNPHLLALMADIMGSAPVLAETLSRHPSLIESVLYGNFYEEFPLREELEDQLSDTLAQTEMYDERMEIIRRFSNEKHFQAGILMIEHITDTATTGRFLTRLADVVLGRTLRYVIEEFEQHYGHIHGGRFCIVGFGKLGSKEMTFGSDVDIIFIYDAPDESAASTGRKEVSPSVYYNRLAQRLLSAVTAMGMEGRLYEADTRLRPFGKEGHTAVSLTSFDEYFISNAWTFEFMALTKARAIAGDSILMQQVQDMCNAHLTRPRDAVKLREDVIDMRNRLTAEFSPEDIWDLKHARGGLMELDFICQYLYLLTAASHPAPGIHSSSHLLEHFEQHGILETSTARELAEANHFMLQLLGMLRLCFPGKVDEDSAMPGLKHLLAKAVQLEDFTAVKNQLAEVEKQVHAHYISILRSTSESD